MYVKLADIKMKKELADKLSKEDKEFLEDCLPYLSIEVDRYYAKEITVNGREPKLANNGRTYLNPDSQRNFEERVKNSGKAGDDFDAKCQKDREFGKIGQIQIEVED